MGALARYKQTVLSAFGEVEEALAALQMKRARREVLKRQVAPSPSVL